METLSQASQNLDPVIVNLLKSRGFDQQGIQEFFSWNLNELPNLTGLIDIEKTSERIIKAIKNDEKIGIYGDYDVDGTTSCALFFHFFKMLDKEVSLIQPSRFIEGYGIHPPSIDKAQGEGIQLLITVDCGITNNEAAEYAKDRGLDLIITDHHKDAREEMPMAYAIVNPSRRDEPEDTPLKPLAGVGVAFAVCMKVREDLIKEGQEIPSLYPLLQFVAIGTICDLAKLTPMNLKLVRHGLHQIKTTNYPGIKTFFPPEERERKIIPSEKLSFNVGPLINSKGRLDHPEKALKLLIADDITKAHEHYCHLETSNRERKIIQAEVFQGAQEQVLSQLGAHEHKVSIVYDESWHEGVIGIVASKLVDSFRVPAIVFTNSSTEGLIKASARTAGALSIFDCLNQCSELFTKFGGHKAAAGLSMPKENLEKFKEKMNSILEKIPLIERVQGHHYDCEIFPEQITPQLLRELESLEPFGQGNPKPVFKMKNIKLSSFDILKGLHVRWNFQGLKDNKVNLKGISFNHIGKYNTLHPEDIFKRQKSPDEELTIYFTLGINRFNGNEYIQLMVERLTLDDF